MITDFIPNELLRPYISKYSFINLSTAYSPEPYVPDGAVKVFIYERDECIRYHSGTGSTPEWKDGVVGTLSPGYCMEILRPIQLTICCFRASAFYQLFQIPIHLLHDDFIPLEEIIAEHTVSLKDQLANAAGPQEKKQVLDQFFLTMLMTRKMCDLKGIKAIESAILCKSGNIRMDTLLRETSLSIRSVERLFRDYIGMPPKQFCKIVRFNRAFLMRKHNPEVSWKEIIFHCGYYDQSHYISEFRSYMGVAPGTYGDGASRMSALYVGSYLDHLPLLD